MKKENEINIKSSTAEYLTFIASTGDDGSSVEMRYEDENIWLTQKMMAALYDVSISAVNQHIKKVYNDNELIPDSTIKKYLIVQKEGSRDVSREVEHYNLQMIISVGFKINNQRAVRFRTWANQIVQQYTIKGWVMDSDRLKNGGTLTQKYFDEQLEIIREIRLSERRFYQKVTDIYATALDYDKNAKTTKDFFAKVQNKIHYAIHGQTAPELIEELSSLELIVSAYLDLAENRARRHIPMTMEDWAKRLDIFLEADEHEVLNNAGKISAEIAKTHAESEFEKYRIIQDRLYESDYDRFLVLEEEIKNNN